jgi:hypothetical protein
LRRESLDWLRLNPKVRLDPSKTAVKAVAQIAWISG